MISPEYPKQPVDCKTVADFCEMARLFGAGRIAHIVKPILKEAGRQNKI
ncbi:hypothetical protein C5S39_10615 [Candidatus Methanophagaceae archaeon]|nr:hypothetical protein C5S39_10615 [Methanophagales archaeon]